MSEKKEPLPTFHEWIGHFRKASEHMLAMASHMDFPWNPDRATESMALHNMYARALICAYARKFGEFSKAVAETLTAQNYLLYALVGRSLLETTATLHYYVKHDYLPLFNKGSLSQSDLKQLITIDDRHLRGGRFDWLSFMTGKYREMTEEARRELEFKKKNKGKQYLPPNVVDAQRNVYTCVEYWAQEQPGVLFAYNLFCELVHPNVGSAFLIASAQEEDLHFGSGTGAAVGASIAEQSLPILGSLTIKPFGDSLLMLIGTIWHEDELPNGWRPEKTEPSFD